MPDFLIREKGTGKVRPEHTHPRCVEATSERGHDHYCHVVDDDCDDWFCFGNRSVKDIEEGLPL